jgi:hypothetical protein
MLRKLSLIMILALFLFSCGDDNSNNPTIDEDMYYFSSIAEEIVEVYTEKGAEYPKSEWEDELVEIYNEFQEQTEFSKKMSYKLTDSVLTAYAEDKYQDMPILMKGDTIMVPFGEYEGEYYGMNLALIIDENTIEFREFYAWEKHHMSYNGTEINNLISNQAEEIEELRKKAKELDEYESIGIFYRRLHYKKTGN